MCEKLEISFRKHFLQQLFFENFDLNIEYENEIEDNNEKIFSRFNYTLPHKIDFAGYGLHRNHPQARGLILRFVNRFSLNFMIAAVLV